MWQVASRSRLSRPGAHNPRVSAVPLVAAGAHDCRQRLGDEGHRSGMSHDIVPPDLRGGAARHRALVQATEGAVTTSCPPIPLRHLLGPPTSHLGCGSAYTTAVTASLTSTLRQASPNRAEPLMSDHLPPTGPDGNTPRIIHRQGQATMPGPASQQANHPTPKTPEPRPTQDSNGEVGRSGHETHRSREWWRELDVADPCFSSSHCKLPTILHASHFINLRGIRAHGAFR